MIKNELFQVEYVLKRSDFVSTVTSGRKYITLYSNILTTVLMLAVFFISGLAGQPSTGQNSRIPKGHINDQILQGRVIVLDPGHGGSDPGTVGVGKTTEAENVLAICLELKEILEQAGATVIMTRNQNANPASGTAYEYRINGQLAVRTVTANRSKGEILISVHNDWNSNSRISGTTSYYYHAKDWLLADSLQKSLVSFLSSRNIGVKHANFYVLRNTNIPSALIEVGFLSNSSEAEMLAKSWYRSAAAQGLFYGIVDYYERAGIIKNR